MPERLPEKRALYFSGSLNAEGYLKLSASLKLKFSGSLFPFCHRRLTFLQPGQNCAIGAVVSRAMSG
ncbi:hypothetical protein [Eikenella halliae]|uniref:hypothetical protein n=1 Tax=Eikenella halliae TaxID=1795832 RepID=UPI000B1F46C5|nr:hypothetical protein [Eikenella halliae]